jgi:hypothetical protein
VFGLLGLGIWLVGCLLGSGWVWCLVGWLDWVCWVIGLVGLSWLVGCFGRREIEPLWIDLLVAIVVASSGIDAE